MELVQPRAVRPDFMELVQPRAVRPDFMELVQPRAVRPDFMELVQPRAVRPDFMELVQPRALRPNVCRHVTVGHCAGSYVCAVLCNYYSLVRQARLVPPRYGGRISGKGN